MEQSGEADIFAELGVVSQTLCQVIGIVGYPVGMTAGISVFGVDDPAHCADDFQIAALQLTVCAIKLIVFLVDDCVEPCIANCRGYLAGEYLHLLKPLQRNVPLPFQS